MTDAIEATNELIPFEQALTQVIDEIERILDGAPIVIRPYTSYLAKARGKFIRAQALIACAQRDSGEVHPDAIKLAAAVEIIHLASLVHDDVMDNAVVRRGAETLHKKFGKRTAVICGDYLMCVALKTATAIADKDKYQDIFLPDYLTKVCLGEMNQHINNGNVDLTFYEYMRIILGKTAALFEASFHAGAVLSGINDKMINKYKRLGRYIGVIFQMTDDCLDFHKNGDIALKTVQSDYEQGVITLPLIYAFSKAPGLKSKAKQQKLTRAQINQAVAASGGIEYVKQISKRYYEKSLRIIDELDISTEKRLSLIAILDKAYNR